MSFLKKVDTTVQKSYNDLIVPSEFRGFGSAPFFWEDTTFEKGRVFTYKDHSSSLRAYEDCAPLAAVVNRSARAYINGKTWVMNTQGKEATSAIGKKLRKLLMNPNPIQSWKQFEAQQQIYIDLYGFCVLLPVIPAGYESFGPIEATALWNIPPFLLTIEESNKLFYQTNLKGMVNKMTMLYRNTKTDLNLDAIYIFKDFIPNCHTMVFPGSRIKALEMQINNIIAAYESRNVLLNYRGALGVFTQEPNRGAYVTAPVTPKMKEDLQKDFRRYGLRNSQWKFIISEAAIKWQQIGIPTRDLMLFEEIQDDIMRICDAYEYPSPLINSDKGPAMSNTKQYKAQLYQDAIIPKAESNYEQWNQLFRTEENNLRLDKDYSAVAVLQEDEKAKWDARKSQTDTLIAQYKSDVITYNRMLFLLGEDVIENGDYYYSEWLREQAKLNPPDDKNPTSAANQ